MKVDGSYRAFSRATGFTIVSLVPWVFGAAGLVLGITVWLTARAETRHESAPAPDAELRSLKLELAASRGENQALRRELDRLVGGGRARNSERTNARSDATPLPLNDDARFQQLTKRLQETLSRFGAGDREAAQTAAVDLLSVVREGSRALPALVDVYMGLSNPEAKKIMLAPMLFIGGPEAREFILNQAETETDPTLKKFLLDTVAKSATPDIADRFAPSFVDRLQSDDDANARLLAVRGLRYAQTPEAQNALLKAVHDPDDNVRLAAMDVLASRPKMRAQLREFAAADPSPHVREVAQCSLMVAESIP